jgi:hypothetical protein
MRKAFEDLNIRPYLSDKDVRFCIVNASPDWMFEACLASVIATGSNDDSNRLLDIFVKQVLHLYPDIEVGTEKGQRNMLFECVGKRCSCGYYYEMETRKDPNVDKCIVPSCGGYGPHPLCQEKDCNNSVVVRNSLRDAHCNNESEFQFCKKHIVI